MTEASPQLCRDSATVVTRLSADTMDSSSYAHIPGTICYLRANVWMDSCLFTLDLPRRRVSPLFITLSACGSVKPCDKSIEDFHVMFTTQMRLCRESRPGGSPTSTDVSEWIMQINGIPLDMTSREQSHHEGTVNLRRRWFPQLTTLHHVRGFCEQSEYCGTIDKYDYFRVSTRCSKPHSPAESRKARSLSNTISVTLRSGLLTAGRWRKLSIITASNSHPEQKKHFECSLGIVDISST